MKKRISAFVLALLLAVTVFTVRPQKADAFGVVTASILGAMLVSMLGVVYVNVTTNGGDATEVGTMVAGLLQDYATSIGTTVSDLCDGLGEAVTVPNAGTFRMQPLAVRTVNSIITYIVDRFALAGGEAVQIGSTGSSSDLFSMQNGFVTMDFPNTITFHADTSAANLFFYYYPTSIVENIIVSFQSDSSAPSLTPFVDSVGICDANGSCSSTHSTSGSSWSISLTPAAVASGQGLMFKVHTGTWDTFVSGSRIALHTDRYGSLTWSLDSAVAGGASLTAQVVAPITYPSETELDVTVPGSTAGTLSGLAEDVFEGVAAGTASIPITQPVISEYQAVSELNGERLVLGDIFPFCIPFDIYNFLSVMNASREAPCFTIPLDFGAVGDFSITIDLAGFDSVAAILRLMELLAFCVGLAVETRKLIRG